MSATISDCAKGPCILKKDASAIVTLKFTPGAAISSLTADVKARIFKASNNSAAPCPLSAGVEYVYKDSFSSAYPPVSTTVTWALKSGSATAKCFKVDVKIQ